MTTMLEKAAAAAWPFLWEAADTTTPAHNEARARLRAALQAIREPDEAMVEAGRYGGPITSAAVLTSAFTAMIDAILNEKPEDTT